VSKLTERQRLIVTIAASVVVTGVLLFLVFSDRGEIDSIEGEIDSLDVRLQAAEVERRKIPEREAKVLIFRAVEPRELAVLPTEQLIADFQRNISTFLSAANMRFRELPESSPEDSELAKGIRVTRIKIKARGDSASLLKFMNLIENDPRLVAVKGFKVQAGDLDGDTPNATVEHDFEIELETYYYRPSKGTIRREHIPGAEQRMQEPELREAIAEFQPERPDTYVLRPAVGRRDALVDPRRTRERVDPEARERQWRREEEIVIGFENAYREIAEDIEMEKALEDQKEYFKLERLRRKTNDKINDLRVNLEKSAHTKSVQLPELVARVEIVSENLKRTRGRRPEQELIVTRAVCEPALKELRAHFEAGRFNEMQTLGTSWNSFVRGRRTTPGSKGALEEIQDLLHKGKILGEFRAMPIHITGVIVDGSRPDRSMAVVNGSGVRAGDRLTSKGDVIIERVEKRGVTFAYKGMSIRKPYPDVRDDDGDSSKDARKG
jgi:hypothetical protein